MTKVGKELLVLAAVLIFVIAACSSGSAEPESAPNSEVSQETQQQAAEGDGGRDDADTSSSSGDELAEKENASVDNEVEDDEDLPKESTDESVSSESSAVSETEVEEDEPESAPTPEADVIPFVTAQEESSIVALQPGQQYQAGTLVGSGDIGIAFKIPQEWTGVFPEGSPAFLLASETRPGLVIMTSQASNSVDEILRLLSHPVPIDQGVTLNPSGQPTANGPWVEVQATATDGIDQFGGYVMALVRDSGIGIFIAAIGPDPVEYYQELALQIAESARAMKTTVASDQSEGAGVEGSASSSLSKEWTDFFSGMRATYISSYSSGTSGGFSDKSEYDFCSNGQFAQSGSSSLSIDTGGASAFSGGSSGGSGTWKIITQGEQVILELNWNDGSVSQSILEYIDSKTYINGERYFITPDNTTCP